MQFRLIVQGKKDFQNPTMSTKVSTLNIRYPIQKRNECREMDVEYNKKMGMLVRRTYLACGAYGSFVVLHYDSAIIVNLSANEDEHYQDETMIDLSIFYI